MSKKELSVIRLSEKHKAQFIEFIKNKPLLYDPNDNLSAYFRSSPFPCIFGAFKKDELMFTLGLYKWTSLPYACMIYLSSQERNMFFNREKNGAGLCFEKMLKYSSENGIVAIYTFRKKRNDKTFSRGGSLSKEELNWFSYTEAIVPKNTRPKDSGYWKMMDCKTHPWTGEIRRIMPKPEFLHSVNYHSSLKK